MSITVNLTEAVETITATIVDGEETITATINELPRGVAGPTGPEGPAGPNSVTSATTSDGTADLDVATITGDGSGLTGVATVDPERSVVVSPVGTDVERGTALVAAYAAAKVMTPNGAALSRTNRAQVVLPPGNYKIASTLTLDTNFVDLVALIPEKGGDRLPTDTDLPMANPGEDLVVNSRDSFRPSPTLVYTETAKISTILQDCEDVRLIGFSIAQLSAGWRANDDVLTSVGAFKIGDVNNSASLYDTMYFWNVCTENFFGGGVATYRDFDGDWSNCIGNAFSFVIGKGTFDPTFEVSDVYNGKFRARMKNCQGGAFSFIGDGLEGASADNAALGCNLVRCRAIGKWSDADTDSGKGSFGGCGFVGVDMDSDCYLEECEAGDGSFGLGKHVSATVVRCTGGDFCFGSDGIFSGTAVDSSAGLSSFGGKNGDNTTSYCDGELLRCTYKAGSWPTNLTGATLTSCKVTQVTTNRDCIRLLDNNSVLTNCDFRVVSGGTGIPVNAATAKSAAIYHCRLNNVANDSDGLGANVTNTADSVIVGNAGTATALQTARTINGVSFDGTANITVAAAAGTLTGTTLASNVVTSSLTSVGTLSSLTVTNNIQSNAGNVSAAAAGSLGLLGRSRIYSSSDGTFQFRNNANSADASLTASSITLSSSAVTPAINGGTAANDDLTLQGTTNATRTTSYVLIQPNGGLTQVGAGTPVTDTALPLQLSTGASGTETNIGINKNGVYGFLLGFKNGTGTNFANYLGGYMRNVTTDPFSIIVNNTQIATTWTSTGSVGLGGTITHTGTLAGAHLIIDGTTGRATFNGPAKLRGYTFATLPTGSIGDKVYITDGAASPVFRANAAGGGSTVTEVFFNGTAWINS